jgi:hypothetical protein
MKDQSTAALNSLSQAGSAYTHFMMRYMQNLTNLIVKENAKMIEQTQSEFQAISHAKTPAEVLQLASEHMLKTTNESLAFAGKIYTLGYEEHSQWLAAVQKQLTDSSASWQAMMDKMPSGAFAAPGLLNEFLNGSSHSQAHSREAKSSRRSAQA